MPPIPGVSATTKTVALVQDLIRVEGCPLDRHWLATRLEPIPYQLHTFNRDVDPFLSGGSKSRPLQTEAGSVSVWDVLGAFRSAFFDERGSLLGQLVKMVQPLSGEP